MSINRTEVITCPNCQRRVSMVYPSKTIYRHYKNTDLASPGHVVCEASGLSFGQAEMRGRLASIRHGPKMPSFLDSLRHYEAVVSSPQAIESKDNIVSIDALRRDVGRVTGDEFPDGSVIRWKLFSFQADKTYTYVAIKTPVGWSVSGNSSWGLGNSTVTYRELVEHLGSNDVSDVALATEWAEL